MKKIFTATPETLASVREEVRALIPSTVRGDEIEVLLAEGEYKPADFVFNEDDCCPIVPVSYRGEGKAVVNGGVTLFAKDFEPLTEDESSRLHGKAKERVVRVDLTKFGITAEQWGVMPSIGAYSNALKYDGGVTSPIYCELFVDNCRMTIARYPDDGYLRTLEPVLEGDGLEAAWSKLKRTHEEWAAARNPKSDIQKLDPDTAARAGAWRTLDDVWVFIYPQYTWADMSSPINRLDSKTGEIELKYVSTFGVREDAPYYFYNVFEELDSPGEWYLDRVRGILYLYPPQDCDFANARIDLSLGTSPLVKMDKVKNITLSGITVTASRSHGMVISGESVTVENCTVSNVAEWGIIINGSRNTVSGCEIMHTGRGGVSISGGDRATLTPSGSTVTNCHIHDVGEIYKTYQPAVQLGGVGVTCSHNELHDTSHMILGFSGNDHVIEYNEIYRACQFAEDAAAIYWGRNYTACGTVIRYNYIHDIQTSSGDENGVRAIYSDDNNGGSTIIGNVFLRCNTAVNLHGGHDIVVRGNLMISERGNKDNQLNFAKFGHWNELAERIELWGLGEVPWQSAVWREQYPHLAEYTTWDPETEQVFPHYCDISGNIIFSEKAIWCHFDPYEWDDPRFKNKMENNVIKDAVDVSAITLDTLRELLPTFEEIPFEKIGRKK